MTSWKPRSPSWRRGSSPARPARTRRSNARSTPAPIDDFAQLLELEAVQQQQRVESKDFIEGVTAFVQKRPAQFTGE